jgi:hypothetical protein
VWEKEKRARDADNELKCDIQWAKRAPIRSEMVCHGYAVVDYSNDSSDFSNTDIDAHDTDTDDSDAEDAEAPSLPPWPTKNLKSR